MVECNPLKSIVHNPCFALTGSDSFVLKAYMKYAKQHDIIFISEATVNQVNQFGGYTGMKPKDYVAMIKQIAEDVDFPLEKIVLSGDHLGPFVWRTNDARTAMEYSKNLVREYVAAGFRKIHLDPTMPLADDESFGDEIIAKRICELAEVAEETYEKTKNDTPWTYRPVYVLGSEVPTPGGSTKIESMNVTKPEILKQSLNLFRETLTNNGLEKVWNDTVAVVAQIGLEFSEDNVYNFNYNNAKPLADELGKDFPQLVFESHSSDYQTADCLVDMVRDRVGILKVGPEVTFKYREGLYALSMIEKELAPIYGFIPSNYIDVLDCAMLSAEPNYWIDYYHGTPEEIMLKRKYSFSDRSRYYSTQKIVVAARELLLQNLEKVKIPLTIISQYLPEQYQHIREGKINPDPISILEDKCNAVIDRYYQNMKKAQKMN